jgi:hypothetical protein
MNEFTRSRLIDLFWDGLTNWDWESWQSAGAEDKETIVTDAIIELGIDIDINEAYDLFWEWADGLDENAFGSEYSESLQEETILESSLTAEEKVDAWHNGTRRENYKAAGDAKLNTYLEIAKRKGYDEIVDIIEGELAKRGVATTSSAPVSSAAATVSDPVADPPAAASDLAAPISDTIEEPVASEAPAENTTPAVTLSEKDLDALLGMAIQRFGTNVLSAYSVWKSAGGFIGSYSLTWRNNNGNPIKSDRAIDKVMDLAYDHNKLIALVDYFRGGSHNIDRYYSIDVPSSTTYIVDRGTIYKQAREAYSYYDSELNWNFYTLTKNKANHKKVKIFLLEKVPALTPEQAEEITTKFFER